MRVRTITIRLAAWALLGCTELSVAPKDHVIREFQILAIHAEPAEPQLRAPVSVTVLAADPSGETMRLHAAWRAIFYSEDSTASATTSQLLFSSPPTVPGIDLVPLSRRRAPDKGARPSYLVDVYLCTGPLNHPERIGEASDAEVTRTLCQDGAFAQGRKEIEVVSQPESDPRLESFSESALPQQNPRIAELRVNGRAIAAVEDGGGVVSLCDTPSACPDLRLEATLDPSSIDYRIERSASSADGGDAGGAPDAGEPNGLLLESHLMDWYVTGGSLSAPRSHYSPASSGVGDGISFGTASTFWRLPRTEAAAVYTLYAVVRDARGGNSWKHYRFSVGNP